jgi:hypothetical protein
MLHDVIDQENGICCKSDTVISDIAIPSHAAGVTVTFWGRIDKELTL